MRLGSMRSMDDKRCNKHGLIQYNGSNINTCNFEFHRGTGHQCGASGSQTKPAASKWDDAQEWLIGFSRRGGNCPTMSSAASCSDSDYARLLRMTSQKGRDCRSDFGEKPEDKVVGVKTHDKEETKKINCDDSFSRIDKLVNESPPLVVRAVCVRDMGTEMTPIPSQEPSTTTTPMRATTPVMTTPVSSKPSSPTTSHQGPMVMENLEIGENEVKVHKIFEDNVKQKIRSPTSLESRAMAWDEGECAKYMARYKREEMKIQAWENHQKRKAELEMRRMELKAEILKSRAQERITNKVATAQRRAEEKHAHAKAKLNEKAAKASKNGDYIRRTGRLPFSLSFFKLPSFWG